MVNELDTLRIASEIDSLWEKRQVEDVASALASRLYAVFVGGRLTLALAESCTGGLVSKILTDIPGSSRYFSGSCVAYANSVKNRILHVKKGIIALYGAVSQPTALAMAHGCLGSFKSDWALSVTGIAGPVGSSDEKQVGTVWIGVANHRKISYAGGFYFSGERSEIRERSAFAALLVLIDCVEGFYRQTLDN